MEGFRRGWRREATYSELENTRSGSIGFVVSDLALLDGIGSELDALVGLLLGKTSLFINCIGVCWYRVT
jgi:hypothetical protein